MNGEWKINLLSDLRMEYLKLFLEWKGRGRGRKGKGRWKGKGKGRPQWKNLPYRICEKKLFTISSIDKRVTETNLKQ